MSTTPTLGPVNDLCLTPGRRKVQMVHLSPAPPRCPFCSAAFYECVTDFRGCCVEMKSSA